MKTSNSPLGLNTFKGGMLLMMAISSISLTQMAQANTAAGTVLTNNVTVNYTDSNGANPQSGSDSVSVTVDLVPGVVWGTAPTDQTVGSAAALPSAYTIDLTNWGNGSDTFAITDNTPAGPVACTIGTLGSESFGFSASVTLGATVSSAAATFDGVDTLIPVSNLTVADFSNGDLVVINNGGTTYTVVAAKVTATQLAVSGSHIGAGEFDGGGLQIGERISFSYGASGTAGTASAGSTGCEHQHSLLADDTGNPALNGNTPATDTVTFSTFVNSVELSIQKYVRNNTVAGKNPLVADITFDGVDYYSSGVNGNPGDTLEYLVVMTNASSGEIKNVVLNDTLPQFTDYVTDSTAVDTDGDGTFDTDSTGEDESTADGGIILITLPSSLIVYAGTAGDDSGPTGGNILAPVLPVTEVVSVVKYQVQIQ